MADHASSRTRFNKLINDLGGHSHHSEFLDIAAPIVASAGFPPDQLQHELLAVDTEAQRTTLKREVCNFRYGSDAAVSIRLFRAEYLVLVRLSVFT
jgi:hypothetical protein